MMTQDNTPQESPIAPIPTKGIRHYEPLICNNLFISCERSALSIQTVFLLHADS